MTYASVCDGIGAVHAAWQPLGWRCAWTSEIEPFPAAVVEHHWKLPNVGDMAGITPESVAEYGPIDVLVGGTPCQSFSVAGLRGGLADPRGNLALVFLRLAVALRVRWVVWENVPGVLSADGGRAFGTLLGLLAQFGYGFAYRVLDAQYFGVPQRRRRVFVVGHLGDWRRAAAVLFEFASLCGNPAPRRETGERAPDRAAGCSNGGGANGPGRTADDADSLVAPALRASGVGAERIGDSRGQDCLVASTGETSHCLNAGGMGRQDYETETLVTHSLRAEGHDASEDGTGRGTPLVASPITAGYAKGAGVNDGKKGSPQNLVTVAFQTRIGRNGRGQPKPYVDALTSSEGGTHADSKPHIASGSTVRRLTPRECERLQGFPDDYTLIPFRGKPASDAARCRAIGNSMAVPVMRWIGERMMAANATIEHERN